jgi:hypothetical protein
MKKKRHRVGRRKANPPWATAAELRDLPQGYGYSVGSENIRSRIASTLGWSEADARGFSLQTLRDLVRPADPALAREIDERVSSGRILL